jgi:hypothetical protein
MWLQGSVHTMSVSEDYQLWWQEAMESDHCTLLFLKAIFLAYFGL